VGAALQDSRGCLTPTGFARVRGAAPGQAPPELAEHLSRCKSCQYRLLSGGRPKPSGKPRGAPLKWRLVALGAAGLLLMLLAFVASRWLLAAA
jgi:hypothetical protein